MLKYFKLVNLLILIVIMGAIEKAVLMKGAFAAENFSPKARKFSATEDYSSEIEKKIRAGITSTAALIVDSRPRMWMRGNWDWNHNNYGSFAWRIVHGKIMHKSDPANDQEKYEFGYVFRKADAGVPGGTYFSNWFLMTIIAAEARARHSEWNLPRDWPGTSSKSDYDPQHTEDEFLTAARDKLIERSATPLEYEWPYERCIDVSVGYDWLVDRKFSDGVTPVLSESDRTTVQNNLIAQAEYVRSKADGSELLFNTADIADYIYVMAGLALYEPSGQGISPENNAKAKQYLDEFDVYWIGKILPALNEQGGSGGWHAGLCNTDNEFYYGSEDEVLTYPIVRILYAHYTATGQSYENSIFSTGALKYAIEFQNHMVYPDREYLDITGRQGGQRYRWIAPLFPNARRRFSSDPEQQWLGELAGWLRNEVAPGGFVNAGSYDTFDQLMWEQKWPNARSADELGCGSRHFAKLGWVCMRTGFSSPDDLAGLFICQRYHWSHLNPYAQNSFTLERKGKLIEGFQNTIWLDDQYQRTIGEVITVPSLKAIARRALGRKAKFERKISGFPTITEGVAAYAPGSEYDVGPGIQAFESTDQYDYMIGDATNAYDRNKLKKFTRGLVWIKENNTFVVFDRVVTKDRGIKKSWVIDPGAIPQVEGDGLVKITNKSGALWIKRILPEQATETMNDKKFEVVPKKSAEEDYFLHVMQAVDANLAKNSPEVMADEVELITQRDQIGVKVGGWKVLFSKSGDAKISVELE